MLNKFFILTLKWLKNLFSIFIDQQVDVDRIILCLTITLFMMWSSMSLYVLFKVKSHTSCVEIIKLLVKGLKWFTDVRGELKIKNLVNYLKA